MSAWRARLADITPDDLPWPPFRTAGGVLIRDPEAWLAFLRFGIGLYPERVRLAKTAGEAEAARYSNLVVKRHLEALEGVLEDSPW